MPECEETALEAVKTYNYWNTESRTNDNYDGQQQQKGSQQQGTIHATLVIDPITQQHANVSLKTPSELVRIQSMELPVQVRPFLLVRRNEKSIHSASQLFSGLSVVNGRAECKVDGKRVNTFDNANYKAPISNRCYSVLAKDCSGPKPKFAITIKVLNNGEEDQQQQGSNQQQKKIRVITPSQVIECQPKHHQQQQQRQTPKLQCTVNGEQVQQANSEEGTIQSMGQQQQPVEYNDNQQNSATITVPGVQVRFDGKKATIRLSQLYHGSQCGLCGHYDDDSSNELCMANDESTSDLMQFHRSFSIQDKEECGQGVQDNFYASHNRQHFAMEFSSSSEEGQNNADWPDQSSSSGSSEQQKKSGCAWGCSESATEICIECHAAADSISGSANRDLLQLQLLLGDLCSQYPNVDVFCTSLVDNALEDSTSSRFSKRQFCHGVCPTDQNQAPTVPYGSSTPLHISAAHQEDRCAECIEAAEKISHVSHNQLISIRSTLITNCSTYSNVGEICRSNVNNGMHLTTQRIETQFNDQVFCKSLCHFPRQQSKSQKIQQPIEKTKVLEFHNKICFSTKPVKQCPDGTHTAYNQQSSNERQQHLTVQMPFVCLERSSSEARSLLRKVRCGEVNASDISGGNQRSQADFNEPVQVPSECASY